MGPRSREPERGERIIQALIDGDLIAYINAAASENDPVEVACMRVSQMMHSILNTVDADTFRVFLSGADNFRYDVNPEYKANRKDTPDPRWRAACKEFLVTEWEAEVTEGYEADDALGINQDKKGYWELGEHHPIHSTIICSIDKDLDMIPGLHYSWPIVRKGVTVREGIIYEVSTLDGIKSFYRSLLVGDRSDNIIGVQGIGPVKAAKIINPLESEKDMYNAVCKLYNDPDRLDMNIDCLWIQREEHTRWTHPNYVD